MGKLDLDDTVKRLADLDRKVRKAEEMVRARGEDATEGQDPERGLVNDAKFEKIIRSFAVEGKSKLSLLIEQRDRVLVLVNRTCETFGEKNKTPVAETLKKLSAFRKDMEDARRSNLLARVKKDKAEKRANERATAAANKAAAASGAVSSANASSSKAPPLKGVVEKTSMPVTKILGHKDHKENKEKESTHKEKDDAHLKDKQKGKTPGDKPSRGNEKHKAHEGGSSSASTDMHHRPSSAG